MVLITFIHIDNITIIGINNAAIKAFKNSLKKHVIFSDSSEIHWLLGIEITQSRQEKTIMLQQEHYIENIIQQLEFKNEPILKTLMQPGTHLQITKHLLDKDKKFIKLYDI